MSLFKRLNEGYGDNLSSQVWPEDGESEALSRGDGASFYDRIMSRQPKALMVRPMNSTWDYNNVDMIPDSYNGEVGGVRGNGLGEDAQASLDAVMEDIDGIPLEG